MRNGHHVSSNASRVAPRNQIRMRPREDSFQVTQSRTVLSTGLNGFIRRKTPDGLYIHQTRMLSCYRWLIDGKEPMPIALSNVDQQSWIGYYIDAPHVKHEFQD